MARFAALIVLINLALIIGAIADCLGGERDPRRLPRAAWVVIILLVPIAGGIAWFTVGRPRPESRGGARRSGPVAPDDDPDFLADLERRLREDNDGR